MSSTNWPRLVASGALWAVVYNFVWGAAWFAFMRREWQDAPAALGRGMPWPAEVWFIMAVLSLPIGVAIMAYAASRAPSVARVAVYAAVAVWVLMTMGMAGWGWSESYSLRILILDSIVNLVAMVAAALAGAWSLRQA